MRSAIATGYVALDVVCHGRSVRHVAGGTAANVAANLAYLGWDSSLAGRIGADVPGRRVTHDLETARVECLEGFRDPDVATPVVIHHVTPPSHRFAFTCPACARRSPRFTPVDDAAAEHRAPHFGIRHPDLVFADRATAYGVRLFEEFSDLSLVMFEPSARGSRGLALRASNLADIVKWSHELRGDLHAATLRPKAGQLHIETLGRRGLRFRIGDGDWESIAPPAIEPVDTAGAGDWLTAAFLDALPTLRVRSLGGETIREALAGAQAVAALNCRFVGARAIAGLALPDMRSAADALSNGGPEPPISLSLPGRRSEASQVCRTCLGPAGEDG